MNDNRGNDEINHVEGDIVSTGYETNGVIDNSGNGSKSVSNDTVSASNSTEGGSNGSEGGSNDTGSESNGSGNAGNGSGNNNGSNSNGNDYEDICYICRRPEHIAGKMVKLYGNVCICPSCLQQSFNMLNTNNIPFGDINATLQNQLDMSMLKEIPNSQRLKKKAPAAEKAEKKGDDKDVMKLEKLPAPHIIKEQLDQFVIGQEHAKKAMSVAVYNHYKRVAKNAIDDIEIEKSNMLMVGPTGCGKTYLVQTLARILNVPLAITDATSLTEAGYIGDDVESVLSKLLRAADNDVEKAERGIVFIDEIDKIAKKRNTNSRDVSGESVQQGLLKLLEGSDVEVPVGATNKNAMVPLTTINTKNILFICGGAFPDIEDIIKTRLNKQSSIGFRADLKDKYDNDPDLLLKVNNDDLREYGMIPEFIGRLPILFALKGLSKELLVKIMKEPKNAILKQYQKLLALDEVDLQFDEDACEAIAEKALEKKTGARALRAIIEDFMLDIMYEIPKDDNIGRVYITKDYIEGKGGPRIEMRGVDRIPMKNTAQ